MNRPAEAGTALTAAVAILLAIVFDFRDDEEALAAVIVVLGAVPAAITFLVNLARGR